MTARRAAIYLRVSTDRQTTANQRLELEAIAARRGWEVVAVYEDNVISGAKGREGRPALDRMLKDAQRRLFDVVMVKAMDRLGRSLVDLLSTMEHLDAVGVDLYIDRQNIDTTTPMGRLLFQVAGAFAEFEREMIRQRIHAGLERARREGTRSGRPIGRPRLPEAIRRAILADRAAGRSIRAIARARGVSPTTVQKVIKEALKQPDEPRGQPQSAHSSPLPRKAAPGLTEP